MTDNKKVVLVVMIIIILICAGIVIFFVNSSNDNNESIDVLLQNTVEDQDIMLEIGTDFVYSFFNYDGQSLRNGKWKENISSFIDETAIKQYSEDNLLYERLYDIEWQLSHMVNDETISEVIRINNIETVTDVDDYSVLALLTLRVNGSDEVDSPYFNLIDREQDSCTINFTSENKIYSIQCSFVTSLGNESNYGNR